MTTTNGHVSSLTKLIIPGLLGNVLEWYDFALYGFFAPIIAQLFFPTTNNFLSLLATFGVFAAGFIMRPLGAIIFGHLGDRIGRKRTLAISILCMAVPTTLIGLLPTYTQVGILAGILLTCCRLLQGLAMSGDLSGSIVYVTEHSPSSHKGFWGSWLVSGCFLGLLMGSGMSAFMGNLLSVSTFHSWGWRVPFLMGSLLAGVGFYLRTHMPETMPFINLQKEQKIVSNPLKYSFKAFFKPMCIILGLNFLPATLFYLIFVYLPTYVNSYLKVPLATELYINFLCMISVIILVPIVGFISDKIGRKPIFLIGTFGIIVLAYPLFILLQQATFHVLLAVQICFASLTAIIYAPIPATFAELVPTNIRYTGMSFPHNLGSAMYGGTTPLLVTLLTAKTNNILSPSFYLIFSAVVTLLFVLKLKVNHRASFVDSEIPGKIIGSRINENET